ncbi:thiamine ABC transporter ATP-binding protein [Vibrio tapetis]|nr:thiamine ABC transporter ATP-binding protein [Vibrio tapetis]
MLELTKVNYQYQQELFTFNLQADQGDIVALMGPSGAGKSTLLALVAGFIEPSSGEISVDQTSLLGRLPHQRPLSMLFQEHNLFAHLTIRENIGLGLHPGLKLSQAQHQQVSDAAELVGIESYLDRLPEQLSGGQKQRVALARCFVQPHPIWLLDEPFSALDPVIREDMLELVKRLAVEKGITIVMVTHHISDAKAIASQFAFMRNGEVESVGTIEELTQNHNNPHLSAFVRAGE